MLNVKWSIRFVSKIVSRLFFVSVLSGSFGATAFFISRGDATTQRHKAARFSLVQRSSV